MAVFNTSYIYILNLLMWLTKPSKAISLFFLWLLATSPTVSIFAQSHCTEYDSEVRLQINDSNRKVFWEISFPTNEIVVHSGNGNVDTVFCFPKEVCLKLRYSYRSVDTIYGSEAKIRLSLNGETLLSRVIKDTVERKLIFNCAGGLNCSNPEYIPQSTPSLVWESETDISDKWYSFTPPKRGVYELSTVNYSSNNCDTRLYVYDRCENMRYLETQEYSYAYNDNYADSKLSLLRAPLEEGQEYLIRVGDSANDCKGKKIKWQVKFADKVKGCTDTNACNYNPLAEISDNQKCIPFSKDCSHDLAVFKKDIYSTLIVTQYQSKGKEDECELYEGCFKAIGVNRQLLNFSSLIKNVGNIDFYIGNPTSRPSYFIFDPCHNHYHYNELVSVNLYNEKMKIVSTGFKAGFCLIDASCDPFVIGKYNSCVNQGISPNCWDYYGPAAICNWIDISDIDTGIYYFTLSVNKSNRPDALGRYERELFNNSAIVKIKLSKGIKGEFIVNVVDTNLSTIHGEGAIIYRREFYEIEKEQTILVENTRNVEYEIERSITENLAYNTFLDFTIDGKISVSDIVKYIGCKAHTNGQMLADKNPYINSAICNTSTLAKNYLDTVSIIIQNFDSVQHIVSMFVLCTSPVLGIQFNFPSNLIDSFSLSPTQNNTRLIRSPTSDKLISYTSSTSTQNTKGFFLKLNYNKALCKNRDIFESILASIDKEAISGFYNSLEVFDIKKRLSPQIQIQK